MMKAKSPEKRTNQVLGVLSVDDGRKFLMDCLNLPNPIDCEDSRPHFDRWVRRWGKLLTFRYEDVHGASEMRPVPPAQLEDFAPRVRTSLRRIWHEKDARQRDWHLYMLRAAYHRMIVRLENPHFLDITSANAPGSYEKLQKASIARRDDPAQRARFFEMATGADVLDEVPRVCPFEAAVYWLQVNQKLMLYCDGPVCPAPYSLRAEKGQKYCSPECADPARREAKLRWWNESPNSPKNRKVASGGV